MSTAKRPPSTSGAGPTIAKSKRGSQNKIVDAPFQPNASGIDIGAREIYIAVPPDRDQHPVRKCGTFTSDLDQMAGMAGELRHHHGGDGVDRGVLDASV